MSIYAGQALVGSSSKATAPLGAEHKVGGKRYRYVLLDAGAATLAAKAALSWLDGDAYEATMDVSAGSGSFAGVLGASGTYTDGEYAWVQFEGEATVTSTGSIADGRGCTLSATDGAASQSASPPAVADIEGNVGRALSAAAGGEVVVLLGAL